MSRKQRTEGQAKRDLVKLCAFVALIIAAFTFTFGGLFNGSIVGDIHQPGGEDRLAHRDRVPRVSVQQRIE